MSVKYLIQENLKAKSYSKVERTGAPYSCLHAYIHWRHAGAGLKNFIHLHYGSFGSSVNAQQCKVKHTC